MCRPARAMWKNIWCRGFIRARFDGSIPKLLFLRPVQPLGLRAAVRARGRAAGDQTRADRLADGPLDSGGDGGGAKRRDGFQPARRRTPRRAQPANLEPRTASWRDETNRGGRVRG